MAVERTVTTLLSEELVEVRVTREAVERTVAIEGEAVGLVEEGGGEDVVELELEELLLLLEVELEEVVVVVVDEVEGVVVVDVVVSVVEVVLGPARVVVSGAVEMGGFVVDEPAARVELVALEGSSKSAQCFIVLCR